jgi:hypothetical protein
MYRKDGNEWHKHVIRSKRRKYLVACDLSDPTTLPENTVPITDLEERHDGKRFSTPSAQVTTTTEATTAPTTFAQYIATLPMWEQQLLATTQEATQEDQETLHALLQSTQTMYLVSDGGAADGHGY